MAKKSMVEIKGDKSSATEFVQRLVAAGLDEKIALKAALEQLGYATIIMAPMTAVCGRYAH
jgi:hypothetical protein